MCVSGQVGDLCEPRSLVIALVYSFRWWRLPPAPRTDQFGDLMAAEVKVTGQNQEQFLLLAKSARGAALANLIHQVLEAPGIYVFGELLDMPNVREVSLYLRPKNTALLAGRGGRPGSTSPRAC